jgi:hypothetical protein
VILSQVEGALLDGFVTEDRAQKLRARFIREGLLSSESTDGDLRQVIDDVNQRLRYAIGEHPNPPASVRVR